MKLGTAWNYAGQLSVCYFTSVSIAEHAMCIYDEGTSSRTRFTPTKALMRVGTT